MIKDKTPLHVASHSGDLDSMQRLLQLGADPKIKCNIIFQKTGIHIIGDQDLLQYTSLHAYARNCSSRSLETTLRGYEILLAAGCEINEYDGCGMTVLHSVVSPGRWKKGHSVA